MVSDARERDPELHVPCSEIPRLHYPTQITREIFEREFAAKSRPCIITGLIDDWPAYADNSRSWTGTRWDEYISENTIDAGFDPRDNRMMHFGDDDDEQRSILFNPGRLRMPVWAFLEVGRVRQLILKERARNGGVQLDLNCFPELRRRLNRELLVQNVPFLTIDETSPLHFFQPISCKIRDLVPISFYLSHDTYALPRAMQEDILPQAPKLITGWGQPDSSRIWVTNGGPWKTPFPPWSDDAVPEPGEDKQIYSCFHCDRMENFHSLIAGQKDVVLVPPGQRDVLKSTRFSTQNQWLIAPVTSYCSGKSYLGSTLMTSKLQVECTSDQSAVHPFRSPEANRKASKSAWPDSVDFQVFKGKLQKGDTLYIPAYHWHFVATSTPPTLGQFEDGSLAMSVNFWWWPIHNDEAMERWSYQNEIESWENRRIDMPETKSPPPRDAHVRSFYHLTAAKRKEAAQYKPWPCPPVFGSFEVVD